MLDQVDQQIQYTVMGPDFTQAHPGAAHHLGEALGLLWGAETNDQVVSEVGGHLRNALMDVTDDVVVESGQRENPIPRLRAHLDSLEVPDREAEVLVRVVELADAVLKLGQRLDHTRDEADKARPEIVWDEIRRACFTTALACYEMSRLRPR